MSSQHRPDGAVFAVVHEPPGTRARSPLVFELCGLSRTHAEAVAARIAQHHRAYDVELAADADAGAVDADTAGAAGTGATADAGAAGAGRPGRHLLRLTPRTPAGEGALPGEDLLADLLAPPATAAIAVSGHQRALLGAAVSGREGPGRYVEQIFWDWTGPVDFGRFAAAWQSLAEREAVLRACLDPSGAARLVLHDHAVVEVVRRTPAGADWSGLLRRERARGFEPYRPGLLRVCLVEGTPGRGGVRRPPARVLMTYHRALLDERGARLLARQFYRAYLAGGVLPGGDRRPDIRDYAHWLERQDAAAARAYWALAAPPAGAALSPGRPGGAARTARGAGRVRARLGPARTSRLRCWAAARGVGESSVLHAVWALLLYRAAGTGGRLPVAFGVHVSGRDMALRAAADLPGLLGGPLPVTLTVDPAAPLDRLLLQARDAVLDLTPHAWACGGRIREGSAGAGPPAPTETAVRFDRHPRLPESLRAELAAQGIGAGEPHGAGGDTSPPLTLSAHCDDGGALALSALHDRARFTGTAVFGLLAQCLHLLRTLPGHPGQALSVGDALGLLDSFEVPAVAPPPPPGPAPALTVLRPGRDGADLVCLVQVPGVTPGAYDMFAHGHEGPERMVLLRTTDRQVPPGFRRELLDGGRRLILCGAGPAAPAAHEIARRAAARTGAAPAVVMTGTGGDAQSARALSRALRAVRAPGV
ncbi:condensation domain-containing protein [Streptomyces sp. NPDC058751]|uniref:condensation domain-containing protein n=1 Tax=Streptomyces sp. NPDC058751 TaxID=3346623 RepID=UPI0036C4F519